MLHCEGDPSDPTFDGHELELRDPVADTTDDKVRDHLDVGDTELDAEAGAVRVAAGILRHAVEDRHVTGADMEMTDSSVSRNVARSGSQRGSESLGKPQYDGSPS